MNRYPLVRLAVGLSLGFFGAIAIFVLVDRYRESTDALAGVEVLGDPDFAGYCDERPGDLTAVAIKQAADGWRCVGLIDGFFTGEPIDASAVCQWQYGVEAVGDVVDETNPHSWRCVTFPDD